MDDRWLDAEIDSIFEGDPELTALAHRVREARPEPQLDPRFRNVLRAQLMREAPAALTAGPRPQRRHVDRGRGRRWLHPSRFAWAGAGLGVALAAAAVLSVLRPVQDHSVTAISPVAELHAVSPDNVITVAFSQPMNQAAVVAGLHIRPATEVTTSWQGNNLVITPTHHLAGNTPYTVTIDHNAARSASGQVAAADIRISFGTAAIPPAAASVVELTPSTLGPVDDGSQLIPADDGSLIVTSSTAAITAPPTAVAIAGPSSTPGQHPHVSPSPSALAPSPSATGTPPPRRMVRVATDGTVSDLGPAPASAALSPNGLELVAAVPAEAGATQVVLVPVNGKSRTVLATLDAPVLSVGWLSTRAALVAEPDRIVEVDLLGSTSTLVSLPAAGATSVTFAPAGGYAFAGASGGDGTLVNLTTKETRTLTGSRGAVAFSGDGATVAWIDATSGEPRLVTSPTARDAAATVPLNHPGDSITDLALDGAATHVAFVDHPGNAAAELDVVALPSGSVVARGPAARAPVFAVRGDSIAFVTAGVAETAELPGVTPGAPINVLPDGAASALQAFVDAQVRRDAGALASLSVAGLDAASATPHGLSRAYVVSEVANADGTVDATARMIIDATADHSVASFADEQLTLAPQKDHAAYVVSALSVGTLRDEPIGPHVVAVAQSVSDSHLVLQVSFDSDLRASTVPGSITVTTRGGRILAAGIVYSADSRTATITLDVAADTPVTVSVATTLVDVDGHALATPFRADTGG